LSASFEGADAGKLACICVANKTLQKLKYNGAYLLTSASKLLKVLAPFSSLVKRETDEFYKQK